MFKVESDALTTPAYEILETEQHFFNSNTFDGSSGAAFNFDYTPSPITAGTGMSINVAADSEYDLYGATILAESFNTSAYAYVKGLFIAATSLGVDAPVSGIEVSANSAAGPNIGGGFVCQVPTSGGMNLGVYSYSGGGANSYGVYSQSFNTPTEATPIQSKGVYGEAILSPLSIGVHGYAEDWVAGDVIGVKGEAEVYLGTNANSWYGVYGSAPVQACTTVAGVTTCAGAAGYFNGDVFASGAVYNNSDIKLKDQIQPIANASNLLSQLSPKQYVYKTNTFPGINLATGQHYGLLAQEVESVLPDLVKEFKTPKSLDSTGAEIYASFDSKAVNYIELIPLLISAVNEQKVVIDSLLTVLQSPTPIAPIDPNNVQKITLSNNSSIILNQNDPNPFNESTNITYSIPEEVKEAKIIFTSTTGVIINTAMINERGSGQLEVYASDLSKGIYQYTLICDGKVIATKKMVKQ